MNAALQLVQTVLAVSDPALSAGASGVAAKTAGEDVHFAAVFDELAALHTRIPFDVGPAMEAKAALDSDVEMPGVEAESPDVEFPASQLAVEMALPAPPIVADAAPARGVPDVPAVFTPSRVGAMPAGLDTKARGDPIPDPEVVRLKASVADTPAATVQRAAGAAIASIRPETGHTPRRQGVAELPAEKSQPYGLALAPLQRETAADLPSAGSPIDVGIVDRPQPAGELRPASPDVLQPAGDVPPDQLDHSLPASARELRVSLHEAITLHRSAESPQSTERPATVAISDQGSGRLEIFLEPKDLGRVRLSLEGDGPTAVLTVQAEREDTADLLRRNSDLLAQEFRAAGFDNLTFSFARHERSAESPLQSVTSEGASEGPTTEAITVQLGSSRAIAGNLDIRL